MKHPNRCLPIANPPPGSFVFSGEGFITGFPVVIEKVPLLLAAPELTAGGGGVASFGAKLGLKLTLNVFGVGVPAGVVTGATTLGGGVVNAIVGTTFGGAAFESRSFPANWRTNAAAASAEGGAAFFSGREMEGVVLPPSEAETPDRAGEADLEAEKKLVVNSVAAALVKNPGPKLAGAPLPTGATGAGAGAARVLVGA